MKFSSLQPFVPSGKNFQASKHFFLELGFSIVWDAGDYISFAKDGCSFILQNFNNKEFAENFMVSVAVDNATEFWQMVTQKGLPEKFGIRISPPAQQPYGLEVNIIDIAGVCWHFVEG
jgi:predicted lactoylglutathione lyase